MSTEVKLPELGENISTGDLLKVLVKVGDQVAKDQAILELETDKAAVEVPSPVQGTVTEILVKEGQKLNVGQTLLQIDENGASSGSARASAQPAASAAPRPTQPPRERADKKAAPAPGAAPMQAAAEARRQSQQPQPEKVEPTGKAQTLEVRLPELGENITSGDLLKVLVKVGDKVSENQALLEIETDKATVEVPAPAGGVVKSISAKEGQKLKMGELLLVLETAGAPAAATGASPGEGGHPSPGTTATHVGETPPHYAGAEEGIGAIAAAEKPASMEPSMPPPAVEPRDYESERLRRAEAPEGYIAAGSMTGISPAEVPAAPSVRRLAREIGVDITEVKGSGPGGRITQEDVKDHSRKRAIEVTARGAMGASVIHVQLPDFTRWGQIERKAMTGVRRKTAEHMQQAWTIPHVTNHDRADITNLEALRKQFSKQVELAGGKLTMTAIAVKIVASALKSFPQFGASLDLAKQEVVYKDYVHVGVAVDTERGLLVPVIRDADKKNIIQIAVELSQLAERARARKLALEEMEGSVFTITNLGGIGGTSFTPIINSPEVAILGMSRSSWEPVYVDEKFEPRLLLPLSLSYDHRIIDGADAARFLRWLCDAFQQPFLLSLQG
ncbi:MAG TPA: dihydrolipoyllysine-residue acetyltransferase [Terriglobales bacterium]|nr:dihydrolipoyllysine-residue acetyltransferase [Terriglobales bacterium]